MEIVIKRAYEQASDEDGYRVLVDRLWPRGVSKARAALDEWCKDVAPSPELRVWFGHRPERFEEFAARYAKELDASGAPAALLERAAASGKGRLTLVYAAKDAGNDHVTVLADRLSRLPARTRLRPGSRR